MSKHIIGMYEKFLQDEYAEKKDEPQEVMDKYTKMNACNAHARLAIAAN